MACFSCGENKSRSQIEMIEFYKEVYNRTKKGFYYFQKKGSSEILIMDSDDFTKFKEKNKKAFDKGTYEWAHVMEFKNTIGN